ncbi:MAG: inorganic phosphate transporter [Bacteroidales bacterium]|nr:inorganic phosphate transporter [Bacteroidales bacterium]HOY37952.1 inorganic phosphate transporter [Bacteroidales bacterium]HQP03191.1 inorganic phosphate transporter [Bacteroidales bacterium]
MVLLYVILVVLILLAVASLVVGVSNDAVNFLNPAVGAMTASTKLLFLLVSVGVVLGATFSNGMMEVARKGIFNPDNFYLTEVMFIFLSVMLTNVILLDAFNTLGLPTSTTVSLVFALLGGSIAMALIKMNTQPDALNISEYINTSKAMAIIFGILFSIVVAFTIGAIAQWIARVLFSFNYEPRMKYLGAIFGGISITIILYFMIIKGLGGSSFMTPELNEWLNKNTWLFLLYFFVASSVVFEILYLLFKINILKVVVLAGTLSLAMAFAGNDLVNFIGVPLAGLDSLSTFRESGCNDPSSFTMTGLSEPMKANVLYLIAAGLIMVLALWFSKKARNVIKTTVNLSRQTEGHERFGSSLLARQIVRMAVSTGQAVNKVMPAILVRKIEKQFEPKVYSAADSKERPAFDMLRASVSLVIASILIALGTSMKLPLSTTYVTFMVSMATSFSDKAWGRESAVYRITGVLSVIGGWFITALISFVLAGILLVAVYFGGLVAIIILILLTAFFFIKSNLVHRKNEEKELEYQHTVSNSFTEETKLRVCELSELITGCLIDSINGVCDFKLKKLKKRNKLSKEIDQMTKAYKNDIYATLSKAGISFENSGVYYVQMIDFLRESSGVLVKITEPAFEHVSNNHKELTEKQIEGLKRILSPMEFYFVEYNNMLQNNTLENFAELSATSANIENIIEKVRSEQIKRIRSKEDPTRSSILVINILQQCQNLLGDMQKMLKAYINFRKSF